MYNHTHTHTVPSTNIGTLGKYEQGGCENKSGIVYPFYLSFKKNHKIPTYHWSKTIESGGENLIVNKCFL